MHVPLAAILGAASLFAAVHADQLVEPTSKDNSTECQCYLVSGTDAGYYQYHRFWEFRSIPNEEGNDFTAAPSLVTNDENSGGQNVTSAYLNSQDWQNDWSFLDGPAGSPSIIPNVWSQQNIYISRNTTEGAGDSTFLTLRASRTESFMSTSQITSNQQNLLHASIRARLRVLPNGLSNSSAPSAGDREVDDADSGSSSSHPVDDGAVVGFFTYHSDTQESDIEVLTYDPIDQVHYSNQPDYDAASDTSVPGASSQVGLPDGLVWTEWVEHRLDWFPGVIRWYANDQLVLEKKTNTPTKPSGLIINLWGDGGEWSGNMSVGGQVTIGVEWVQMVFNVSGDNPPPNSKRSLFARHDEMCEVGCRVDQVQAVGNPEVAYNSTSSIAIRVINEDFAGGFMVCGLAILTTIFLTFV